MINQYKKNILLVCAHPDDEILGCGGTIYNLKQSGKDVFVLFVAEGISARYEKKSINTKLVKDEIDIRNSNANKALGQLGIHKSKIFFNDLKCCRLDTYPLIEITKIIEKTISKIKPSVVFTHNNSDINIDHQIVHKATISACRPVSKYFLEHIYLYEVLSSTEWNTHNDFKPQVFVDITNSMPLKIKALKKYKKEILKSPNSRSLEKVIAQAEYRGAFAGYKYAEAFQLFRSIKI